MGYPKWLYASAGRKVIVANPEKEAELTGGWFESPADVPANEVVEEAADPAPEGGSEALRTVVAGVDAAIKRYYTAPAKLVAEQVSRLESIEEVEEIGTLEQARPGGPRQTVLKAILAKLETESEQKGEST